MEEKCYRRAAAAVVTLIHIHQQCCRRVDCAASESRPAVKFLLFDGKRSVLDNFVQIFITLRCDRKGIDVILRLNHTLTDVGQKGQRVITILIANTDQSMLFPDSSPVILGVVVIQEENQPESGIELPAL